MENQRWRFMHKEEEQHRGVGTGSDVYVRRIA